MQQTVVEAKRDALRVQVRGGVVAQVLRVAEDKAGAMEVVRVPGRERQDGGKQRGEPSGVRARRPGTLRSRSSRNASQIASATGVTIAVSFDSAASEKRMAAKILG